MTGNQVNKLCMQMQLQLATAWNSRLFDLHSSSRGVWTNVYMYILQSYACDHSNVIKYLWPCDVFRFMWLTVMSLIACMWLTVMSCDSQWCHWLHACDSQWCHVTHSDVIDCMLVTTLMSCDHGMKQWLILTPHTVVCTCWHLYCFIHTVTVMYYIARVYISCCTWLFIFMCSRVFVHVYIFCVYGIRMLE